MKAKTIKYERVINLGNYESERIGIEIELEGGERAAAALDLAKKFVSSNVTKMNEGYRGR